MGNNLWPSHLVLNVLGLYLSNFPADWLSLDINWVYCLLHIIHQKLAIQKKTCDYIKETDTFKSTATGKPYTSVTCKTECVVYLIECKRCQMQYVGMTMRAKYLPPLMYFHSAGDNKTSAMGAPHHHSDDTWLVGWQWDNNNQEKAGVARTTGRRMPKMDLFGWLPQTRLPGGPCMMQESDSYVCT